MNVLGSNLKLSNTKRKVQMSCFRSWQVKFLQNSWYCMSHTSWLMIIQRNEDIIGHIGISLSRNSKDNKMQYKLEVWLIYSFCSWGVLNRWSDSGFRMLVWAPNPKIFHFLEFDTPKIYQQVLRFLDNFEVCGLMGSVHIFQNSLLTPDIWGKYSPYYSELSNRWIDF